MVGMNLIERARLTKEDWDRLEMSIETLVNVGGSCISQHFQWDQIVAIDGCPTTAQLAKALWAVHDWLHEMNADPKDTLLRPLGVANWLQHHLEAAGLERPTVQTGATP